MSVCVYDSPITCCREGWQDGELVAQISMQVLLDKGFIAANKKFGLMPWFLNIGDWKTGQTHGDISAIGRLGKHEDIEAIIAIIDKENEV